MSWKARINSDLRWERINAADGLLDCPLPEDSRNPNHDDNVGDDGDGEDDDDYEDDDNQCWR